MDEERPDGHTDEVTDEGGEVDLAGVVLTHRVSGHELDLAELDVTFDLAALAAREGLSLAGEPVDLLPTSAEAWAWVGPPGWLDDVSVGATIAVHVGTDGELSIDVLDAAPAVDEALAARIRAAYDEQVSPSGLPVGAVDVVALAVRADASSFSTPQAPLTDLCAAAGLDVRGRAAAHDDRVWAHAVRVAREDRVRDRLEDDEHLVAAALRVLDTMDLVNGVDATLITSGRAADAAGLRAALADLEDDEVRDVVTDELFAPLPEGSVDPAPAFVAALLDAASRPTERGIAHWLAALRAERQGDLEEAERQLLTAHAADGTLGMVIDRLAWYASDRGDAARAVSLWRLLQPTPALEQDLRPVEAIVAAAGRLPGRNEPCWCGSGRKFKQCHQGAPPQPSLADRVPWLWRKAEGFLDRAGSAAYLDYVEVLAALAGDPDEVSELRELMRSPIPKDLLLVEDEWFAEFLLARAPLLPADEVALAAAWVDTPRRLWEVVSIGGSRDDRTATLRARDADDEDDEDEEDGGEDVVVPLAALPQPVGRGSIVCARVVDDGAGGSAIVGGTWAVPDAFEVELQELLDEAEGVVIAEWIADPAAFSARYSGLFDELLGSDGEYDQDAAIAGFLSTEEGQAMLGEIRDRYEREWCDEALPQLDGATPRDAAADPDRRAAVEALIDSFEPRRAATDADDDEDDDAEPTGLTEELAPRPARLRELLGLDPRS